MNSIAARKQVSVVGRSTHCGKDHSEEYLKDPLARGGDEFGG